MSESSLRKIYTLPPRHIRPGDNFDQFNVLLNGRVRGLWKNEFVSNLLVSPFSSLKGILSKDFLNEEICTSRQS